jgi:hypothetical protein
MFTQIPDSFRRVKTYSSPIAPRIAVVVFINEVLLLSSILNGYLKNTRVTLTQFVVLED